MASSNKQDLLCITINYKSAPVEARERFALSGDDASKFSHEVMQRKDADEVMILSTCNRTEFYLCGVSSVDRVIDHLCSFRGLERSMYESCFVVHPGEAGIRHLFQVASSLDSMVLGEPQILGQVKDAYRKASASGTIGRFLNKLLESSFHTAKRVRSETSIASAPVSVPFVVLQLAKQVFDDLSGKRIMLIGAGEMSELTARHFHQNGIGSMVFLNRTLKAAQGLAAEFGAPAYELNAIDEQLDEADIIVVSTGSPVYLIQSYQINRALKHRRYRPILLIDISVPRNIDPKIEQLDQAYLFNIDDLQKITQKNQGIRQEECQRAVIIVEEELARFQRWREQLQVAPVIRRLRGRCEKIRRIELEKQSALLDELPEKQRQAVYYITSAIVAKMLHEPLMHLKQDSVRERGGLDLIVEMFNLAED